jgi:ribose/xylose/arabinose/galactoside ABC-type transport system permease subunit
LASRKPRALAKKHADVRPHPTPSAAVTGRTAWDIFETYKDRYGVKFLLGLILVVALLLAFVHWQTPVGKNVSLFGFNLYVKHDDAAE